MSSTLSWSLLKFTFIESVTLSNHPGLTSLKSKGLSRVPQHHNSKASILWHSAFFMIQLSHLYITTGKTKALTIWTFVGQVMSLLFNTLSRFVTAFLPRDKCLLISWQQSLSAGILEPKRKKPVTVSTFLPSVCHKVIGPDAQTLAFVNIEFQAIFFTVLFQSHQEAL